MQLGPKQLAWVDALRSGKYKQGKYYLRAGNEYCCLGVACEVTGVDESIVDSLHHDPKDQIYSYGDILSSDPIDMLYGSLPYRTQNELKIRTVNGFIPKLGINLIQMNDGDYTFPEIADKIEEYSDEIFTEPA